MFYKQSEATAARRWIYFECFDDDAADAYAPKTGLTFSSGELKIAKAGVASANATNFATVVEAGNGGYWYPATAAELDTIGPVVLMPVKTDVFSKGKEVLVVSYDPYNAASMGLSNLDATVSSGNGASLVATLLAEEIDGETIETILRIAGAVGAAKRSVSGGSFILRDMADTTNLVTATVDGNGNVTAASIA